MSIFFSNISSSTMLIQGQASLDLSRRFDIYSYNADNNSLSSLSLIVNYFEIKDPNGGNAVTYIDNLNRGVYENSDYSDYLKKNLGPKVKSWTWNYTKLQNEVLIFLPKGTLSKKMNVGGDTKSNTSIYITWSIDDGPNATSSGYKNFTKDIFNFFYENRINNLTWFFVKFKFPNWHYWVPPNTEETANAFVRRLHKSGGEIGIHTAEAQQSAWFPGKYDGKVVEYDNISEAIKDLDDFHGFLKREGIYPKFFRPPGGLVSEMQAYLKIRGRTTNVNSTATNIVRNTSSIQNSTDPVIKEIRDALHITFCNWMTKKNYKMGVGIINEGHNPNYAKYDYVKDYVGLDLEDWNAVSHPDEDANDTMQTRLKSSIDAWKKIKDDPTGNHPRGERHFVILTHDRRQSDNDKTIKDFDAINTYAKNKGIKLVYKTISQMYEKVHGRKP